MLAIKSGNGKANTLSSKFVGLVYRERSIPNVAISERRVLDILSLSESICLVIAPRGGGRVRGVKHLFKTPCSAHSQMAGQK